MTSLKNNFKKYNLVVLQMAEIYDASQGLVKIGPCSWSPNLDIAFWMSQDDDTILKVMESESNSQSYKRLTSLSFSICLSVK